MGEIEQRGGGNGGGRGEEGEDEEGGEGEIRTGMVGGRGGGVGV